MKNFRRQFNLEYNDILYQRFFYDILVNRALYEDLAILTVRKIYPRMENIRIRIIRNLPKDK